MVSRPVWRFISNRPCVSGEKVKISGARQDNFISRPDPEMTAVLLFGPDRGLIRERALTLAKGVVEDLNDPFRVVDISTPDIKGDPARLIDEATALSLGGGRRLIRIRDAGDAIAPFFEDFLDTYAGDTLVVLESGELSPRSSLRKLFEKSKKAAAVACYADDGRNLGRVIRDTLNTHGIQVSNDAMSYLMGNLGSDRSVTRGELDKLALYIGDNGMVELEDAISCIGDSSMTTMDDICYAAASGNQKELDKALNRALSEGIHAVGILRAAARHFMRLHQGLGLMEEGKSADQAMKSLRPPVIFMHADQFGNQLRRWKPNLMSQALEILIDAEIDCKTTGMPAEAVCGRALMRVAQAARKA